RPAAERRWLERVLGFREGTVGRLMSRKMVVAHDHLTLKEIVAGLQRLSAPPFGDTLFVTDQHGKLRGVVPLPWALLRAPEQPVSELMVTELLTFMPDETIRDAAPAFMRSGLLSAPVVDPQGALLGCLTVEKVMAYLRAERDEALLHFTGLPGGEELFTSGWQSARNRWRWLAITVFAALISAAVIGLFQTAIAQLVALAVLLPIVARLGATSGYQSSALVMRALALGPLGAGKGLHLLRKELGTGLLNGALLGVLVGAFVFALYSHAALAGVAAAALLLTLPSAALAGIGVPLLLDRLGRSPTRGVSVLISALTDSLGFFIFLGLATLFLP
ncbi:MAG TPA: magnesium transporter, partial [Gammaproteobacteria bacterium]